MLTLALPNVGPVHEGAGRPPPRWGTRLPTASANRAALYMWARVAEKAARDKAMRNLYGLRWDVLKLPHRAPNFLLFRTLIRCRRASMASLLCEGSNAPLEIEIVLGDRVTKGPTRAKLTCRRCCFAGSTSRWSWRTDIGAASLGLQSRCCPGL
jgi:hypothetical protein